MSWIKAICRKIWNRTGTTPGMPVELCGQIPKVEVSDSPEKSAVFQSSHVPAYIVNAMLKLYFEMGK